MKRITIYLSTLILIVALSACKQGKKGLFTPTSSGRPYELLVVVDNAIWDRPAGRSLYNALDVNVPGLPQAERSFRLSNIDPQHFDRVMRIFRNIIVVDIQDIYTQPKMKYSRNLHAAPQMLMTIQAPNEAEFEEYVEKNKQVIVDFFVKAELNRQMALLKEKHNIIASEKMKDMFGCEAWIPEELNSYKVGENFLWVSTNRASGDLNYVMYSYPYRDLNTFTEEYFVHKRDSVMKINLPGEREGMYMATDARFVTSNDGVVKGEFAQEVRGLWQMEGDMMGGPFVSHVRVDKTKGRIVVAEIFVYSPDKLKRNFVRLMEASLYTLQLPNEVNLNDTVAEPELEEEVYTAVN
ncbi:MAG: DUF4837 family protein [Phocaeicola sp.]